jgi:predicted ATP-grasp superfamily ATP-dependent carboligase
MRPGDTTSVKWLTSQKSTEEDDPHLAGIPRPRDVLAARLRAGAECLVARVHGAFAGMHWIARGQYVEDEVRCQYRLADPVRMVWDFDVHVEPALRSSRVFARLWQAVDTQLAAQGVQWTCSRISVLNAASLAAHARLGASVVGRVAFLVAGRWQLCVRAWPPFVHLAGPASTGPTLVMRLPARAPAPSAPPAHGIPRNPAALVLGLDSHGLAVARALADAGVTVYSLKRDLGLPGALTNRVRGLFLVKDFTAAHLVPALERVRAELSAHDAVVLLANNDRQVEAIAQHLPELLPLYHIVWADQAPLILQLQKKNELEAVSLRQGLDYPRSVLYEHADAAQGPAAAHTLRLPVILKPVRPLSSFKTLLLQRPDELGPALQQYAHDLPILGQEYVAGGDEAIYFGALMLDRGRVLHGMAGRKIASHPPARGQTTIAETVHAPDVLRLTEQFFAGMGLSGPVSLELKRDPAGRHWVIEPTVGRTDFWVELCIGAGFNQPLMEYQLALGLPVTPPAPQRHCVWYDTERDPLAWLRLCWQERTLRPRGGRQMFTYWRGDDVRPLWSALRRLMSKQAARRLGRLKLWRRQSST